MDINNNTKLTNSGKLNNSLLDKKKKWVTIEIKKELKTFLELNENVNIHHTQPAGHSESTSKRQVHSTKLPTSKSWRDLIVVS